LQNAGVPRPPAVSVRPLAAGDRGWVRATLLRNWSSTTVARRGELIEARDLTGYVALLGGRRTGLVLVDVRNGDLEVVAISTSTVRRGVGRALIKQCVEQARERGCQRVWLITTNNNVAAIAFYQHIGMDLCAYYRYGVRALRHLKPSIPRRDRTGVPIDHELEFELLLDPEPERGPT
jgi:ribosomal protein S18 acetylase RimI-like enzyme